MGSDDRAQTRRAGDSQRSFVSTRTMKRREGRRKLYSIKRQVEPDYPLGAGPLARSVADSLAYLPRRSRTIDRPCGDRAMAKRPVNLDRPAAQRP